MNGLLGRAVLAFLLPWLWLEVGQSRQFVDARGLVPLLIGIGGLLGCVSAFSTAGKGTLAPWAPPRHLVVTGLYRFSRNPMYIAVVLILCGWAWGFHSRALAV